MKLIKFKTYLKRHPTLFHVAVTLRNSARKCMWLFPFLHKTYQTTTAVIGLDIIEACNLQCPNCEASSHQAPGDGLMAIGQIEHFVEESIQLDWKWERIKLRGGEPTLHPHFFDVLDVLRKYKDKYPDVQICLQSNRHGKKVQRIIANLPNWVIMLDIEKEDDYNACHVFNTYNVAPVDRYIFRRFYNFSKGCFRTSRCNMGLSRHGYYPCSPGASLDRVFGFDVGLKCLSDANAFNFRKQMEILCKYCGHYKEPNESILDREKISPTWREYYRKYRENRPQLSLY